MKKILILSLAGSMILTAGSAMLKRYEVKSAKILYAIRGSGDVMGMVQTETKGKKRLIFADYGAKEITELVKVTKTTTNGKSEVQKHHSLQYMNGSILYSVNFKRKKIIRMKNPALAMGALFGGGKSMAKRGNEMMKKMGGKMIGKDKVLGYSCDVWDLMGIKQCIYKGIPLKIESNIMGQKSTEVAVEAKFNLSLDAKEFKLPAYPLVDKRGNALALDRGRLEEIDAKQSTKAIKSVEDASKAMAAGMKALVASGVNLSSGKDLTPEQEQVMQKAIMAAMGGEKSMLSKQKQEIMENFEKIPQAKACFEKASNVAQANACEKAIDSEDPEYHTYWSKREKAKILREIESFESAMPCIKAAESFQALKQCMPLENK